MMKPPEEATQPDNAGARPQGDRSDNLTYEDVAAKADELMATRKAIPLYDAVLEALGRGSMTTVRKHMLTWRTRLFDAMGATETVPDSVLRSLLKWHRSAVTQSWLSMRQQFDVASADHAKLLTNKAQLEQDLKQAQTTIATMRVTLGQTQEQQKTVAPILCQAAADRIRAEQLQATVLKVQACCQLLEQQLSDCRAYADRMEKDLAEERGKSANLLGIVANLTAQNDRGTS